jgi:hypothetical protein
VAEKLYIIELMGEDPMTRTGIQPVRASRLEEDEDYLYFFDSNGTVAALFRRSVVRNWRESSENELEELGRKIDEQS